MITFNESSILAVVPYRLLKNPTSTITSNCPEGQSKKKTFKTCSCTCWFRTFYFLNWLVWWGEPFDKNNVDVINEYKYRQLLFCSPEPKAQVSFSDLCVVRRRYRCRWCRWRCRKHFTFSSFSQEPLVQFQSNLAQSLLGWREFKYVQMKTPASFQGEIITK